ncbi:hypothetical protein [Marivita sp.]|uniref:hypothetical protein n=1 Tax=Marivita sp. TaxID=2003365 RepID=UPI003F6BCC70
MKHVSRRLKRWFHGLGAKTLITEQQAIPVVTVAEYRGNLALKHDRAQHRRYTAHFEDMQN